MKILVTLVAAIPLGISITGSASGQLLYSPEKTIPTNDSPGSVALRPGGGFVVTVPAKRRVLLYRADGTLERKLALPIRPNSVAVKNNGQLLIGDKRTGEVGVYDATSGNRVGFLGRGPREFKDPVDIAIDRESHAIYVVDGKKDHVRVFRWDGKPLSTIGKRGTGLGQFKGPVAIAVQASTRDVFVSDFWNGRIHIFNKMGDYISAFGIPPTASWFRALGPGYLYRNAGVAVDGQGRVLIADIFNGWVQAFDRGGKYLGMCAVYGKEKGKLMVPGDIAVDIGNRLIATSSLGSPTSSTEVEVFKNVAGGGLVINKTPQPVVRTALIKTEPFFRSANKATHSFRAELWGVSADLIENGTIRLNGKYEAVGIRVNSWSPPCFFDVLFRQSDVMSCIKTGKGSMEATITGTLEGGGQFSGVADLMVVRGEVVQKVK